MLEHLKDVITEMEALLTDCCVPIVPKDSAQVSRDNNLQESKHDAKDKKSNDDSIIQIEPWLGKVLTVPFLLENFDDENSQNISIDSPFSLNKLKFHHVSARYSSIFHPEGEIGSVSNLDENKFPIKSDPEEIKSIAHQDILVCKNSKLPQQNSIASDDNQTSMPLKVRFISYILRFLRFEKNYILHLSDLDEFADN